MRNVIQLYEPRERSFYQPSGHKLHAHGRLGWLHRLLWRALLRMGAIKVNTEETIKVYRVLIDEEALFDRVRANLDAILRRGETPKEILLGPDTFSEMMNSPELRGYNAPFSFDMRYGYNKSLYGLPVHVLPWMEGVLVR